VKTIGLIGGMSWESSIEHCRIISEVARDRLGGVHSARNVMVSEEGWSNDRCGGRIDQCSPVWYISVGKHIRIEGVSWQECVWSIGALLRGKSGSSVLRPLATR
jgi:hypothetical protein